MKKLLGILVMILLCSNVSYGALFYGKETLPVVSKPEGAECTLKNNKGSWKVKTPTTVKLKLSKKDLEIVCKKDGYKTKTITIPLKDKNDLSDGVYDNVKIFDSKSEQDDFVLDAVLTTIDKNPVDIAWIVIDYGGNVVKKTASVIKKTASKTGKFLKKSVKAESTYANALINSSRLDQQIIGDDDEKIKKQGYYSMIYIELEKN